MNKEKQIEEMADIIFESSPIPSVWRSDAVKFAELLYNAGYRKASDVAREIITDMREMIKGYENIDVYLDRIEKKYTEDGK